MLTWLRTGSGALVVLVACSALGAIVDLLIFRYISSRTATGTPAVRTLARSIRGLPASLGLVAGLAAAQDRLPVSAPASHALSLAVRGSAIVLLTAYGARILGRVVRALVTREETPLPAGTIFVNLARALVWVLGGLALLATLGVSIAPLVTALGVSGLAVGLALQPTLENVFSGIQLLASRQIQPGDVVRLETGEEGVVLDVTWRNTLVKRPSNEVAIVPNAVLARATVVNFSASDEYVLFVPVSVASAHDPDEIVRLVREVAEEVISSCEEAVPGSTPTVRFVELAPPAAVVNVGIRCRGYPERMPVRHELIRRLAKRFSAQGLEPPPIPYNAARRP